MSAKETKPNTAKLLRDFERCKAEKQQTAAAAAKAASAYETAEAQLRRALGLHDYFYAGIKFYTTPDITITPTIHTIATSASWSVT